MNQILMIEDKKKKKNKSASSSSEITNIVRFFAVVLIIFGIFFIGQGSYAIYRESKGKNIDNMPTVDISRVNDTAIVKVNSINIIENLIYSWNDAEETKVPVGDTYIREEIILPIENSVLNIRIEEETGRMIKYSKEFIIEGQDITEPTIEKLESQGNTGNVKITAKDETAIAYITYKINEEEQIKIDKSQSEDKEINYILKLPRGENKLVITAVDEAGNAEIREETIIVSGKTDIKAEIKNNQIIIILKDEDGVKDIEINLNGVVHSAKDVNAKEVKVPLDLAQGKNIISIKVTNVNSLVTTVSQEFNNT